MEKKTLPDQLGPGNGVDDLELVSRAEEALPPAFDPPAMPSPEDEDLLHLPPVVKAQAD
jgi:hypothetical protein